MLNLNRRAAIKFGSGMSAASFLALTKGATDPVPAEAAARPWHNPEIYDPAAFAEDLVGRMITNYAELLDAPTLEVWLAYKRAHTALIDACPELAGVPFDHQLNLLDEAAMTWAQTSFDAGVKVGAQIEHLRRTWKG